MVYALYYTLNTNLPKNDLTQEAKENLVNAIVTLNETQCEAVFLLICEHHKIKRGKVDKIPYSGTQKKLGVGFDMDKLPIELKWILHKFVEYVVKTDK